MLGHIRKTLETRGGDTGASAVEYALLVVAIALIMVVGAFLLGGAVKNRFTESGNCVNNVSATATSC